MRRRTLLTLVLIGLMLMIAVLVLLVVLLLRGPQEQVPELAAAPAKQKEPVIVDPYAGREQEAVSLVQQHKVLDPAYLQEVIAFRERRAAEEADPSLRKRRLEEEEKAAREAERAGTVYTPPPQSEDQIPVRYTTVQKLIDAKYLEERFAMSFLVRGPWRALHLETDVRGEGITEINDDPFYEVHLDYVDGEVTIGPVWVVDIVSGTIVPRNEMAEFFEFTPQNVDRARDILSRPERVVRAITNHRFESGIELGGVLLLHFVSIAEANQKRGGKRGEDGIVGWTVSHEFRDTYNAYFQWIEGGKPKVAQFRFDWSEQRLEPRGLNAIDLMVEGEERKKIETVSIWPTSYTNDLNIPPHARWSKDSGCHSPKDADDKRVERTCNAFTRVLEQVDFIESVQWLLTTDEESVKRFEACKANRKCTWQPKFPDAATDPVVIEYNYVIGGEERGFTFKVDPDKGTIEPVDDITRWAYFSVTPRT